MYKKLFIYKRSSKVILFDGNERGVIFNLNEYKDILNNLGNDKYNFFNIVREDYKIVLESEIKEKFLYLFNFILVNNISNYIIDEYIYGGFDELVFSDDIRESKKDIIKLTGALDIDDVVGDIIICLLNSDEYLDGKLKMDYENIDSNGKDQSFKNKKIDELFYYESKSVKEIKEKLKIDLIAFKYISEKKIDEKGRYVLPVYIDDVSLKEKGIENYDEYIVNWLSLSYLHMLVKIHDHFADYYNLKFDKGLVNDDLMLSLISLLEARVENYPQGLNKSIEKGRETSGKCYFIDGIVKPISITQDLALILQSKDAFSVVPKIFKSNK